MRCPPATGRLILTIIPIIYMLGLMAACLPEQSAICLQITVYESLIFSARLRHSRETDGHTIFAFVREVRCHPDHCLRTQAHWHGAEPRLHTRNEAKYRPQPHGLSQMVRESSCEGKAEVHMQRWCHLRGCVQTHHARLCR